MESMNSDNPRARESLNAQEFVLSPSNSRLFASRRDADDGEENLESSMEEIFEALGSQQKVSALLALHLEDKQRIQTSIGENDALLGGSHADDLEYNVENMYDFNEKSIAAMCKIRTRSLPPRCETLLEPLFYASLDSPSARSDSGGMVRLGKTSGLCSRDALLKYRPIPSDEDSLSGSEALPEISPQISIPHLLLSKCNSHATLPVAPPAAQKSVDDIQQQNSSPKKRHTPPLQRVQKQGVRQMKQWQKDGLPPLRRLPKKRQSDNLLVPTPLDSSLRDPHTPAKLHYSEIVQLGMALQQPTAERRCMLPHAFSGVARRPLPPTQLAPKAVRNFRGLSRDSQHTPNTLPTPASAPSGSVKDHSPDTPVKTSSLPKKKVLPGEWQEVRTRKSFKKNADALNKDTPLFIAEDVAPPPVTPPSRNAAKKGSAKKTNAPKKAAPKDATPKNAAPENAAPKDVTPKDAAPKKASAPAAAAPTRTQDSVIPKKKSKPDVVSRKALESNKNEFEGMSRRLFTGISVVDEPITTLKIALAEYGRPDHHPTVSPVPVIVCFCLVVAWIAYAVRWMMPS